MLKPTRGLCLVRKPETEETLPGGYIVLTPKSRDDLTACQVEIVDVGPDSVCEDLDECGREHETGEDHRGRAIGFHRAAPQLQRGAWALIRHRALLDVGENDVWLVAQDDVLAVLEA